MQKAMTRIGAVGLLGTVCWLFVFSAEALAETSLQQIQGTGCVPKAGTHERTKQRAVAGAVIDALRHARVQDPQSGRDITYWYSFRTEGVTRLIKAGMIEHLKTVSEQSTNEQLCVTITGAVKPQTLMALAGRSDLSISTGPAPQEFGGQQQRTRVSTQVAATSPVTESTSTGQSELPRGVFESSSSKAELYVGGYGGLSVPNDLHQSSSSGILSGYTLNDQRLQNSGIFGVKIGMFFPGALRWLGVETEVFNTTPHVKQQDTTLSGMGQISTTPDAPGSHLRVTTVAVNLIARYPGTRFQPYVGIGFGEFFYHPEGFSQGQAPGLNALAGMRIFLTERLALFGEYKYTRAILPLQYNVLGMGTGTINETYSANALVG